MELKEFAAKAQRYMEESLGEDYLVSPKEVRKNNGVSLLGLFIRKNGGNIAPTIYLESFLESYENGVPLSEVLEELLEAYRQAAPQEEVDLACFQDFSQVRDHIVYRVVNAAWNADLLSEVPHIRYLDLAICFSYLFYEKTLGIGSIMVYNNHVAAWKSDAGELYRLAKENTKRLLGEVLVDLEDVIAYGRSLGDILREQKDGGFPDSLQEAFPGKDARAASGFGDGDGRIAMKLLTNQRGLYGAAAMLYPDILRKAAGMMDSDLFVLPSSVHEVLLVPDRGEVEADELRRLVREVNATQVDAQDLLSDEVYRYDRLMDRLEMAERRAFS